MNTPGNENLCLYVACLQALGERATLQDARNLKARVHTRIGMKIMTLNRDGRDYSYLQRAYKTTHPATSELATDEVLPALASVLERVIVVHERCVAVEVGGWEAATAKLHIYYTPGHYWCRD